MTWVHGETSLTIDEAVARIAKQPRPTDVESLGLADALGRFLAEDVVAHEPVPAHASSAMDGYAFRYADYSDVIPTPVQGRVAAGHPLGEPLLPGHTVRIFTGGMMPEGADTVAMQEDCLDHGGGLIGLPGGLALGENCRPAGDDIAHGATVLQAGARLRPQDLGVAASVNRGTLPVHRRVRVGLVATGDELRPPGEPLPPGCVRDSNRHTISAALRSLGALVTDYGITPDERARIREVITRAAGENDLVVSTGGVSVGEEDHVRTAVEQAGRLDFWRLRLKPGGAVAVGETAGTPFVGLPGNPVASMIAFWVLGRPLLLHLMGARELGFDRFPVVADFDHPRRAGRREFLRARIRPGPDASLTVSVFRSTGSGMLSSLTWSDGLIDIGEDCGPVRRGDVVQFVPYSALLG
jgi:molybdopterin molybdotransferase